ncbi:hypothetical protein T484DRAFT_1978718, partial [Baffinella frigidus]
MDLVRHSDGALCAEGHLTCRACLDGHVQNSAGEELRLLRQREGRVFCPNSGGGLGCAAAPFSDSELGQSVSAEVFESYIKGRMRLLESRLREEVEEEAEGRLQAELLRLQELDEAQREVLAARKHVEDQILTPSARGAAQRTSTSRGAARSRAANAPATSARGAGGLRRRRPPPCTPAPGAAPRTAARTVPPRPRQREHARRAPPRAAGHAPRALLLGCAPRVR